MDELSPMQRLLEQWLLLPLFADFGMIAVLLRSARGRAGLSLAALLTAFALGNMADMWPKAPGFGQLPVLCASFIPPLVLLFLLSYAGGRRLAGNRVYRILILLVPALLFAGAALLAGWRLPDPVFAAFSLAFLGIGICFLLVTGAEGAFSGDESIIFGAGMTLLVVSGPVYDIVFPDIGLNIPIFPYTSAATGALFAWATVRYKAFSAAPTAEDHRPGGPEMETGLFLEKRQGGAHARALFVASVRHGMPGLLVTRTHPAAIRRRTGLMAVPVIWLARSLYEKSLQPERLDVLSNALRDYAEQSGRSVALIEDLDYLITNAGHHQTLDFLGGLQGMARRTGMTLLLSSGLLTDEERRDIRELGVKPMVAET